MAPVPQILTHSTCTVGAIALAEAAMDLQRQPLILDSPGARRTPQPSVKSTACDAQRWTAAHGAPSRCGSGGVSRVLI